MKKKLISYLLILCLLCSLLPSTALKAEAATYSGTCGDNLTWTLDTDTGELTISGAGAMTDYSSASSVPWYSYRSSIKTVAIGDGVTSIGDYAFYYCISLTDVTIPSSVTEVGTSAFEECSSLTDVTIPYGVKSIGQDAFYSCNNLISVMIPDSVETIGIRSFADCKLIGVSIPGSVTRIDDAAFLWCDNLTGIWVDETNAFYSSDISGVLFNKNKTFLIQCPGGYNGSYIIPGGVTRINDNAFRDCSGITSVSIPDSVTSIGGHAFYNCRGLTNVTIPDSVTSIGSYAFAYCGTLTGITIPGGVSYINSYAFYSSGLTSVTILNGTTNIGQYAFYNCSKLTNVVIPDSMTTIRSEAFGYCSSLSKVVLPKSVTSIKSGAFVNCSSLNEITVANAECTIADDGNALGVAGKTTIYGYEGSTADTYAQTYGFDYAVLSVLASGTCGDNLTWELTSDGILTISGSGAMTNYTSWSSAPWKSYADQIRYATIENGVTGIGDYAFYACNNLASVTISESVNSIGSSVFSSCDSLSGIYVAEGNLSYSNDSRGVLFDKSKSLLIKAPTKLSGEYSIPVGVVTVCDEAFMYCDELTDLTIPESVTSIGTYVFRDPKGLKRIWVAERNPSYSSDTQGVLYSKDKSVLIRCPVKIAGSYVIPDDVNTIQDYAFYGCSDLTAVTIPDGVADIGSNAFYNCSSLTQVILPKTLTSIPYRAFYACSSLESVTIPQNVTTIGGYAFNGCTSLRHVHFLGDAPSLAESPFPYSADLIFCYIEGTQGWDSFYYAKREVWDYTYTVGCTRVFYTCNTCGEIYEDTDAAPAGHSYNYDVTTTPTTTKAGQLTGSCVGCSDYILVQLPMLNTTDYEYYVSTEPTCESSGVGMYAWKATTYGGFSFAVELEPTGHSYYEVVTAPTCTEKGYTTYTCSVCSNSYVDDEVAATGHVNTQTVTVDATCTENGSVTITCECGHVVSTEILNALGHSYNTGVVTQAPTCTAAGVKTYTCTVCSHSYTESIPATGHAPVTDAAVAPTCTETGLTEGSHCGTCGEILTAQQEVPAKGHSYQAVVTKPTCTEKGYTTYTCSVCSNSYVDDEVAATGHSHVDGVCSICSAISYKKAELADISSFDKVIITMTDGTTVWAMTNDNGIDAAPTAIVVSVENDTVTTDATNLTWNIVNTDGLLNIYPAGITNAWLYCVNSNNGIRVGTGDAKIFTIDAASGYLANAVTATTIRYLGVYKTNPDWRCYTHTTGNTANQTLAFYAVAGCAHTNTIVTGAVSVTCTTDGYTGDTICSDCGELVTVGSTITAVGAHSYVDGICSACGVEMPNYSGRYYIAAIRSSGNYYYMTNSLGTASTKRYQAEDSGLTTLPETIAEADVDSAKVFVLELNADGTYRIYAEGIADDARYLGWSSANSGTLVEAASALSLTVDYADGIYTIHFTATDAERYLSLNSISGNNFFAWYKSVQAKDLALIPVGSETDTPETECVHANTYTDTELPTCTTAGATNIICSDCGEVLSSNEIGALGHSYNTGVVTQAPTCTAAGVKTYTCTVCSHSYTESIPVEDHTFSAEVTEPTYFESGYTTYTCSVCGYSYQDDITAPLTRTPLSAAEVTLEYTAAYYKGAALEPKVSIIYDGVSFDPATELKVTYADNNKVGTATVTVEGINKFEGTVTLTFEISYETLPEQIVNVAAIGELKQISLSWGISAEVNTAIYRIYRKAENEADFTLLKTIYNRSTLSYTDTAVEEDVSYAYYVTGVGIYGEESVASNVVTAKAASDQEAPVITKIYPVNGTRISGNLCLTATVSDNVGTVRVVYTYSVDGETWLELGASEDTSFAQYFDTTALADGELRVRAVAYDAAGNASDPFNRSYTVDNTPPEQVTGLATSALYSNKLTLVWSDSVAEDRASYIVQLLKDDGFETLATVTALGYNVSDLLPDTDYTFRIACTDTCGNQGPWSEAFTVRTTADITAPTITKLSPEPYRLNSDLSFSATAKDACGIASISIQASTDLQTWTTLYSQSYTTLQESRTCSYTVSTVAYEEGYLYLRAVAADGSGNRSAEDGTAAYNGYYIDRTSPAAPIGVTAVGNDGYITVSWTQGTEEDIGKYSIYRADAAEGEYTLLASGLGYLSYHDRGVQTGVAYYYKVAVTDTCGNLSQKSAAISAKTAEDTQNPVVNSFSTSYNMSVSDRYPTVSVLATDNSRLSELVIEYKTELTAEYAELSRVSNINDYSKCLSVALPTEGLAHGTVFYLRAYAIDTAGLYSDTLTAEYTLDREAPQVLALEVAQAENVFTLNWSDNGETDLSGFRIFRSVDGNAYKSIGSRGANAEGKYSFTDTVSATQSHTYTYQVTATDRLGNSRSVQSIEISYCAENSDGTPVNKAPTLAMDVPAYMEVGVEDYFDASASTDDGSIVSYLWDFGDGTSSSMMKPVKKYTAAGIYTVSLTVTDDEGAQTARAYDVTVKERSELGILNIKVTDNNYKAVAGAQVVIDYGKETQLSVYTDASGMVTVQLPTGEHEIAAFVDSHHLPAAKTVTVLSNATRTVSLILVKEELVTGEFEITRMTLDEILAAGIDVYDPANQIIYQVKVQVTYGSQPLTINYTRNETEILSYYITDSGGRPIQNNVVKDSNGNDRVLTPTVVSTSGSSGNSGGGGSDIVAILDIPAQVSFLKEFFDVKLYITNHAGTQFALVDNEITLNVPEGMTLMTGLTGYEGKNTVSVASIAGQETVVLNWCLRGDVEGDYDLTADYIGTLEYFDTVITASFETREPVKVYGMNGIEMSVLACDEIQNGAFYFKIGLKNERDVDLLMPNIGLYGLVENVTESAAQDNQTGDFLVQTYILNAYVESANGAVQYLPLQYDANGDPIPPVDLLAPGQKLVYEYVAYNAVKEDTVAYFTSAAAEVLSGYAENVVVGSYDRTEYSLEDFSEKLDRILNAEDGEIASAYEYIMNSGNYYYTAAADDSVTNIFKTLYEKVDTLLTLDLTHLTLKEQREFAQQVILTILLDQDTIDAIDDQVALKYLSVATNAISQVKYGTLTAYGMSEEDFDTMVDIGKEDLKNLTKVLAVDGQDAFKEDLYELIKTRAGEYVKEVSALAFYEFLGLEEIVSYEEIISANGTLPKNLLVGLNALDATLSRQYIYSALRAEANYEYSNYILDTIIDYCRRTASDSVSMESYLLSLTLPAMSLAIEPYDRLAVAIAVVAQEDKLALSENAADRAAIEAILLANFAEEVAEDVLVPIAKKAISKALGAAYELVGSAWSAGDQYFGIGEYYKQHDSMIIYDYISTALMEEFQSYVTSGDRTEEKDLYALTMLKSICMMRLEGERQYKGSVMMYVDREGFEITEAEALELINKEKGTSFESVDDWYDNLRYNALTARDILFNKELTDDPYTPAAPIVTLDYELNRTHQSFSSKYEYCFADGVWIPCDGNPICFIPKGVPSVLRVRIAASDENLAGNITTVYIYAQKELSGLITAKYDGTQYLFENLTEEKLYQMVFLSEAQESPDWTEAITFAGTAGLTSILSLRESNYLALRSCVDASAQETYSVPLVLAVAKRQLLELVITGSGSVQQSSSDGCYFMGETAELTAVANAGQTFEGWYVDGNQVSTDPVYLYEMGVGNQIEARFTGAQPSRLVIVSMPGKLIYTEGEAPDVTGLRMEIQYEDGSTALAENYTATFAVNAAGGDILMLRVGTLSAWCPVEILHGEGEWVVVQTPSCSESGLQIKYCSSCGKELERQDIAATGHFFVNGVCACGLVEVKEPAEVVIKIGHTVSFDSDKKMNYRIKYSDIAAVIPSYVTEGAYLTVEKDRYPVDGEPIVETVNLEPNLNMDASRMIFTFDGIQSVEMGSELRAVLHIFDADGNEYMTPVDIYSVLAYAQLCFDTYTYEAQPELLTMLIDSLNYGAAAQIYFNRRTDCLVNAGLEAYQQYASTELSEELNDVRTYVDNDREITAVTAMGFTVNFADKTEINTKLTIGTGYTKEDITCVKVLDSNGNVIDILTDFTELSDGRLQVTFYGVKSIQMRDMFYFVAYAGDQVASQNVGYSVEAYAKSNVGSANAILADMVLKCMYYGDAAYAYFNR